MTSNGSRRKTRSKYEKLVKEANISSLSLAEKIVLPSLLPLLIID
jgi:hypothetical protein